jgi:anti-anti-sigma regulatory factor
MVPITLTRGWTLDVERGPEWLIVRPHRARLAVSEPTAHAGVRRAGHSPADKLPISAQIMPDSSCDLSPAFAEQVWTILQQNFAHRLVLELDEFDSLDSHLIGELMWLYQQIHGHEGMMRICGLSAANQDLLYECALHERFASYRDREDAIMGDSRPNQPR